MPGSLKIRITAKRQKGITVGLNFWTKGFLVAILILSAFFSCTKTSSISPVNVTSEGVAIKGYDPVAYFTEKRPVKGTMEFEYVWQGAQWRFANANHREVFQKDPEKYAPRYGGYCAYTVSQGKIAHIDPEAWTIFEGKLYLNLNKSVRDLWEKDLQEYILKADENWPHILGLGK